MTRPLSAEDLEFAVAELCDVIEQLCTYLHPGTSHSEPGDDEALERAAGVLARYKAAS